MLSHVREKIERQRDNLREQWKDWNLKPRRHLWAIEVSEDYAESWKMKVLCEECYIRIEPPLMAKRCGYAGAKQCEWCGVLNLKG